VLGRSDEFLATEKELPLAISLAVLTIREGEEAIAIARRQIDRAENDRDIIDLTTTIGLYKITVTTQA
jgi:predicted transposase YdaD